MDGHIAIAHPLHCPDCGSVDYQGVRVYLGEGRWVFQYECRYAECENFGHQYRGALVERDQRLPDRAEMDLALLDAGVR